METLISIRRLLFAKARRWKCSACCLLASLLCLVILPIAAFAQSENNKLWDGYIAAGGKAKEEQRYETAEIMFLAARKEAESFGPYNHRVATTLYRLAQLLETEQKFDKAEPLFKQALAIWEKDLGPEPSDVAQQINQLATAYYERGKYLEAVALYERARAIGRNKSESEPATVTTVLSSIGLVYKNQGKTKEAERLYTQLLAIMQKVPDKETLDVPKALVYLRELNDKRDDADVEQHYNRALKIQVQTLGSRASEFAIVMNGLSDVYYQDGQYSKAEQLCERALEIQREVLAPDDPRITTMLNSLAEVYFAEEKYAEAASHYKEVLAIRTKTLGPKSIDLVTTLNALGRVYNKLEQYAAAEFTLRQALRISENAPDSERPETSDNPGMAGILNNLAHAYYLQRKYVEAEHLLKRALISRKANESKTLYLKNLSVLYREQSRQYMEQGRYAEAEPILQQVIAFYMDPSHQLDRPSVPDLASMLDDYSSQLRKLNRVAAADEWHARAEAMRKNNPPQN